MRLPAATLVVRLALPPSETIDGLLLVIVTGVATARAPSPGSARRSSRSTAEPGATLTRPIPGSGARLTPIGAATTIGVLSASELCPTTTWNSRRVPANSSVSVAVPAAPVMRSSDSIRLPAGTNAVVPTSDATAGLLLVTVTGVGVSDRRWQQQDADCCARAGGRERLADERQAGNADADRLRQDERCVARRRRSDEHADRADRGAGADGERDEAIL